MRLFKIFQKEKPTEDSELNKIIKLINHAKSFSEEIDLLNNDSLFHEFLKEIPSSYIAKIILHAPISCFLNKDSASLIGKAAASRIAELYKTDAEIKACNDALAKILKDKHAAAQKTNSFVAIDDEIEK